MGSMRRKRTSTSRAKPKHTDPVTWWKRIWRLVVRKRHSYDAISNSAGQGQSLQENNAFPAEAPCESVEKQPDMPPQRKSHMFCQVPKSLSHPVTHSPSKTARLTKENLDKMSKEASSRAVSDERFSKALSEYGDAQNLGAHGGRVSSEGDEPSEYNHANSLGSEVSQFSSGYSDPGSDRWHYNHAKSMDDLSKI